MRLIDADALIEKCGDWYVEEGTESGFIGTLKNLLATEPTIQPEPHEGEWEQVSAQRYFMSASYFYRCSVCGENNPRNTKYCPNCGAKMKGEPNERTD